MKVLILGGGISGLSAAWFLKRKDPKTQITLLEKTDRLGGWIRTDRENGYLFEKGPRTFPTGRSSSLLELIRDLGLESELIFSDPSAARRFLWRREKLRSFSSFLPRILPALIREPFIKRQILEEESIYDFAARRFSPKIGETLFEPMALGIYAGDIRRLSVRSCFPKFVEWEREKGSVLKGMFGEKKKARGLFTLQGGMGRLVEEMQKQLDIEVIFHCPVEAIRDKEVDAGGKIWKAETIFSALPASAIGGLLKEDFPSNSLTVVNLAFSTPVLSKRGFGYLVPSLERESLLGMIWDSSIFPQQNSGEETRLTAMVRPEEKDPVQTALNAVRRHLGINAEPALISVLHAQEAIPQFEMGHSKRIALLEEKKPPSLTLLGNYLEGVSVEACIQRSFKKIFI